METAFGLVPPVNNKYFIDDWNDFSSLSFSNHRARRPLALMGNSPGIPSHLGTAVAPLDFSGFILPRVINPFIYYWPTFNFICSEFLSLISSMSQTWRTAAAKDTCLNMQFSSPQILQ